MTWRARRWRWVGPQERVLVIDEDQGQSAKSAEARRGFQQLLAEVSLDHVGLVLGIEMSRFGSVVQGLVSTVGKSVRCFAHCCSIRTACMIRPTTTTDCCWGSKGR